MPDKKGGGGKPPGDYSSIGKGDKLEGFGHEKGNTDYRGAAKRQAERTNKITVKPQEYDKELNIKKTNESFDNAKKERDKALNKDKSLSAPKNNKGSSRGGSGFLKPLKDKIKNWLTKPLSENEQNIEPENNNENIEIASLDNKKANNVWSMFRGEKNSINSEINPQKEISKNSPNEEELNRMKELQAKENIFISYEKHEYGIEPDRDKIMDMADPDIDGGEADGGDGGSD